MRPLLDDQQRGIDQLSTLKVGALFMEAGTGKTQTACELVNSVQSIDYVLWIGPFQTIHGDNYLETVPAEVEKCGGINCKTEYVGIESIQSSDRIFMNIMDKVASCRTFMVCDESITIKNFNAKRTKRLIFLANMCEYKLILNGTPLSKNMLDLWSQFEFLSTKILNMSYNQYKNTFCEWVKVTKKLEGRVYVNEYINGYHNIDYLYSLISPYVYECSLNLDVQDNEESILYTVDNDMKEQYKYLKTTYLDNEKLAFLNNNIFLEMTQKMQHTYSCSSEKFEKVREIISHHSPSDILIACKYIDSQIEVAKAFPNIEVLSFGKHMFGLNKQKYNIMIFWDKTFNYLQKYQLKRRLYRTGQVRDCKYYSLTGDLGLEKMIDENIIKKKSLLEYFKAVGRNIKDEL